MCFFSYLQSCQPYGFRVIVLIVNQYCAKKYVNLIHKIPNDMIYISTASIECGCQDIAETL